MRTGAPKVIIGFAYEYTHKDHDYTIRTMNTKHPPAHLPLRSAKLVTYL